MNRRNFLNTITIGTASIISLPMLSIGKSIPLYNEFDWLTYPSGVLFRIEESDKKYSMARIVVYVKTHKTEIFSDINTDYTKEVINEQVSYDILGTKLTRSQVYYTNKILLKYAKKQGFTHLYGFFRNECPIVNPVTNKPYFCYYIRGLKMPDWKTVNGKLQIVNV